MKQITVKKLNLDFMIALKNDVVANVLLFVLIKFNILEKLSFEKIQKC